MVGLHQPKKWNTNHFLVWTCKQTLLAWLFPLLCVILSQFLSLIYTVLFSWALSWSSPSICPPVGPCLPGQCILPSKARLELSSENTTVGENPKLALVWLYWEPGYSVCSYWAAHRDLEMSLTMVAWGEDCSPNVMWPQPRWSRGRDKGELHHLLLPHP